MKYIENYNKLLENNEEKLFNHIIRWDDGDYLEEFVQRYRDNGAFFNDDYDVKNYWSLKYLAYDAGKKTSVIFFNSDMEHNDLILYLSVLIGKKLNDIWDKRVIEGTYWVDDNELTCRGLVKNDTLNIITNKLFSIRNFSKSNQNNLNISIGSSVLRSYDTIIKMPYKDYNFNTTDNTLSILYKILDMYYEEEDLMKDFDIVSAVSPLPNDIQSKVIGEFNRMFKKNPNMKIRVLPKGLSTAEYNHKKTKYKFTESKDIET